MRRALLIATGLLCGAVLLLQLRHSPPPNILLVVWDTVRADRMSLYGHNRPTTPFLARLGAESLVYEHAIASSEWTAPTHASIFTGLPLQTHGVDVGHPWLDDGATTLAEHLRSQGYATFSFSGNRFVSDTSNMLQGFQTQEFSYKGRWKGAAAKATQRKLLPRDASTEISPAYQPTGGHGWSKKLTLFKEASAVANRALKRWLQGSDRPFFAFINLMEAHQPRVPSLTSRRALMSAAVLERALHTDSSLFSLMAYTAGKKEYTEPELEALRATYDASILDLDRSAERLITGMEAAGLLENTIVVFTSDHGELLGEHHLFSHRWALYEPLIHVPLLIYYPKKLPPKRVSKTVSMTGLFRSLTDLAGLPAPPGVAPALGTTKDVVSELRDPNQIFPMILRAFPDADRGPSKRRLTALIRDPLKLIQASDHRHELYDLSSDPHEQTNLFPAHSDPLIHALHTFNHTWPDWTDDGSQPTATDAEDTTERLKVLGYAD